MDILLRGLRSGKAMVTYIKPQQRKTEKNEGLRREGDAIEFIGLRFEKQFVGFGKGRRRQAAL